MIVCDIAEYRPGKMQAGYPVLMNSVTAAFHENMSAAIINHLP
jgi:hypothetical protein